MSGGRARETCEYTDVEPNVSEAGPYSRARCACEYTDGLCPSSREGAMKKHRARINAKLWALSNAIDALNCEIENRQASIDDLYNTIRGQANDGTPRGTQTGDSTAAAVVLIERQEREKEEFVQRKEKAIAYFKYYIQGLNELQQEVLCLRYLKRMKPQEISKGTHYSEDHIKRLIGMAQDKLN